MLSKSPQITLTTKSNEGTSSFFNYMNKYQIYLFQLKPKFEFCEFPQKKLFKSNKSEVVQERRNIL